MIGNRESCVSGILHMSLQDILKIHGNMRGRVSISYMQIYNERISDLLHPSDVLSVE